MCVCVSVCEGGSVGLARGTICGGGVVVCLCCPLEKELTGSAGETRGANVKI